MRIEPVLRADAVPSGSGSVKAAARPQGSPSITPAPPTPFSSEPPRESSVSPAPATSSAATPNAGGQSDPLWNAHLDPLFKNASIPLPPDPVTSAHGFAADYLQRHDIEGDPDNIYLSAYDPQGPYTIRIMSMTDMVLKNRQKELNDNVPGARVTSLRDAAGKEISGLDSSDFQSHIWKSDFAGIYRNQVDDYFAKNGSTLADALRAGMLKTTTQQVRDGSLSVEGGDLVSRGLGAGPYTDWTQLTQEKWMQPLRDWGVRVSPLKINDAVSGGAYLFTDKATGKTAMFLPGNSRPFHQFDSQNQIPDWINNNVVNGSEDAKAQFTTYFPADQTKNLRQLYANLQGHPEHLRETDYFDVNHLEGPALPADAPASHLLDGAKSQLQTLGNELITSDAQWGRQTAAEYLNAAMPLLLPLSLVTPELGVVAGVGAGMAQMGLGVYQHNAGRSSQEREEGLNNTAMGFLNAALSTLGGETKLVDGVEVRLPDTGGKADSPALATPSDLQAKVQPDGHGVYRVDNKEYVTYDGKVYRIHVQSLQPDRAAVIDPETGEETGQIFRRDAGNQWAPDTNAGLKGGNDESAASEQQKDRAAGVVTTAFRKHMGDKIHENMVKTGDFWKGEPIGNLKSLSHDNVLQLMKKLGPLRDYEKVFLDRFLNEPLFITHASDEQRGVLLSRQQLAREGLLTEDKVENTMPADVKKMATDDHVFFSLEHGEKLQKPASRFGDVVTRYTFDQPRVTQTGMLQLLDLVDPVFPAPGKYFKDITMTEGRRREMIGNLNKHASELRQSLPSAVFYGSDMKRGLALSILDRLRSIGRPDVEGEILAESNLNTRISLNTLINGLFRPQVLVPRVFADRPVSVHHL